MNTRRTQQPVQSSLQLVRGTAQVAECFGITGRMLQWWDERGIVRPTHIGHARHYEPVDVLAVAIACAIRKRGQPLKLVGSVTAYALRKNLSWERDIRNGADLFVVVSLVNNTIFMGWETSMVGNAALACTGPLIAFKIGPDLRRLWAMGGKPMVRIREHRAVR